MSCPKWNNCPEWRTSSSPLGSSSPPPRPRSAPSQLSSTSTSSSSPCRSSSGTRKLTPSSHAALNWRTSQSSPSSFSSSSSSSFSPSSSSFSSSRSSPRPFSSGTRNPNRPFEEAPFVIQLQSPGFPGYFDNANEKPDWNEQWAFAQERIKQKGNPRGRAKEARIFDWWHPSDDDPTEHLSIAYMYDPALPERKPEEGGGCYIKLHIYRTDEQEMRAQEMQAQGQATARGRSRTK